MPQPAALSNRTLNRTLLQRQHLLERVALSPEQLAVHLVGLQAQDALPPYIGMFSRIADFDPMTLSKALESRDLVRVTLMRGTIHLVTADDAIRMRSIFQREFEKALTRPSFFYGALKGVDLDELQRAGESAFGKIPLTTADVRAAAAKAFPERDPAAVAQAWYYQLPLLQVPPRGLWRRSGKPVWARIEEWLGRPLSTNYPASEIVARYLAAFGPATTQDIAVWSRLPAIGELIEQLGERVRTYRNEDGQTFYDVTEGSLAPDDCDAPVRFLGWYDNVYLSHKSRARIASDWAWSQLWSGERRNVAPILIDGYIQAGYLVASGKKSEPVVMRIRLVGEKPDQDFAPGTLDAVEKEAVRLLEFLEPDRAARIEFVTQL